ncbi:MAG: hypothetical protein IPO32_02585 [Crocinitomicaceae bacterium]|nr:hypothetical protein [Crocinitomicaceae bacterium]
MTNYLNSNYLYASQNKVIYSSDKLNCEIMKKLFFGGALICLSLGALSQQNGGGG